MTPLCVLNASPLIVFQRIDNLTFYAIYWDMFTFRLQYGVRFLAMSYYPNGSKNGH
jgi:hypothetical protein